jgi:hypothetical protein
MNEFSQDSRPIVAEDRPPTAFRVKAGDDAPALNANFHPSAAIESYDALEDRSPGRLVGSTLAHYEAKSVASGSAENLSGSTAEVKICTPRIPVPPATKPDCQTSELYSEIKRMIAAEINRVLAAQGQTRQLTPEKVGHKLKKVGMFTRRLSHAGNGLSMDRRPGYVSAKSPQVTWGGFDIGRLKPPLPLPEKNELFREVMEVVEDLPESGLQSSCNIILSLLYRKHSRWKYKKCSSRM